MSEPSTAMTSNRVQPGADSGPDIDPSSGSTDGRGPAPDDDGPGPDGGHIEGSSRRDAASGHGGPGSGDETTSAAGGSAAGASRGGPLPERPPIWGQLPVQPVVVHPRIAQQTKLLDDPRLREPLDELVGRLKAHDNKEYYRIYAFIDWDHQLPSQSVFLRVAACYDRARADSIARQLATIAAAHTEDDLFPEFDLVDYTEISGDETYTLALQTETMLAQVPRFASPWRRDVEPDLSQRVTKMLRATQGFQERDQNTPHESIRGALVAGWTAPCVAQTENWAIEVWQVIEFDGQQGKAHVYTVDGKTLAMGREYETDIQISR